MNDDWDVIEEIFHATLELPAEDREAFIAARCPDDPGRRAEILSLIDEHESGSDFLSDPIFETGLKALERKLENSLTGKTIGPYRIESKIGAGGMGEVYRAFDTRLERTVALKFLSDSLENDGRARRQLAKEARAAAALEHPNICAVHGLENIDGHQFIAMQHIDGVTLDEHLGGEPLPIEEFRRLAKQIVSAVAFAHSHGIIHRDLKPGNIMVASDGSVKVLDFGLAKVVSPLGEGVGAETSRFSTDGLIIGTVSYMSPEQLRGEKLDFRSDIFSLGIILCEMLTGKNPFARPTQAETIAAIMGGNGAAPPFMAELPIAMRRVIVSSIAGKTADRLSSVAEIGFAIDEIDSNHSGAERGSRLRLSLIIAGLVALFALAIAAGVFFRDSRTSHSLAILPPKIEGNLGDKEYLAQGVIRGLTDRLGSSPDVKVRSEYVVDNYRRSTDSPASIGKSLRVDAVITGVFSPQESGIVLRVSLIRVSDGQILRSEEYTVDDDTDRLSRSISSSMLQALNIESESMRAGILRGDTDNPEAKKFYTLGRQLIGRKTGDDVEQAIAAFTNATQLDPNYAKAWAGLADSYLAASMPGVANAISPKEAAAKAKNAVEVARGLDPGLCEVYSTLGLIALRIDWNWNAAETNFRKSIELNAEFPAARAGLISVLTIRGRFTEAMAVANQLKEFDTGAMADIEIAKIQYRTRDFESMRANIENLTVRFPFNDRLPYIRSYELLANGKYSEAITLLQPRFDAGGEKDKVLIAAPLGFAYARAGERARAAELIEFLDGVKRRNWVPAQEKALIYVGLRDFDRAFANFELSCAEKFQSLPPLINDPIIDEIRSDPRFKNLMDCVGLL